MEEIAAAQQAAPGELFAWRDPGPMLRSRSIGIVGASPGARWVEIFLEQIPQAGFHGPIWPIHPSHREIGDRPCYPNLRATPGVPEHLLLHVSVENTLAVLEDAAAAGVGGATIYSTGWAEAGEAGKARQEALAGLIQRTGFRICGPNCLGFMSVREGLIAYPLRVLEWLKPGGIGVVFQSGALVYPFVRTAGERGAGFSYVVSCGNEVGFDVADYMKFLIEDPQTSAIALLLEGVRAPEKFRAALEMALEADKPVAVMKVGRTERARESTLTHTGALAGSSRVFDALCRRYAVALCDSLEQLVETTRLLAHGKRAAGPRAAVLVFSGSLRSHILDTAAEAGLELAQPAPVTIEKLQTVASLDVRIANPLDCGVVQATQSKYMELASLLLEDPGVDVLLVEEHAPDPKRGRSGAVLKSMADTALKPVLVVSESAYSRTPYTDQFIADSGIPFLQGIERGLKATGDWIAYAEAQRQRERAPMRMPHAQRGAPLRLRAGLHGLGTIGAALERYGVPVVVHRMARTVEDAEAAANDLGYPVALKIESADVAHKSDAGGVCLGLADGGSVRRAWAQIHDDVARHFPSARLQGALVARMAGPGIEMSLGVQRDAQFGLALMVGLGGVWIEVLDDVSLRLLPADEAEAHCMIAGLKASRLLGGFRGAPPGDVDALVAAMMALSHFALDHADRLVSVDINPLIVHERGRGATAVDARIVFCESEK